MGIGLGPYCSAPLDRPSGELRGRRCPGAGAAERGGGREGLKLHRLAGAVCSPLYPVEGALEANPLWFQRETKRNTPFFRVVLRENHPWEGFEAKRNICVVLGGGDKETKGKQPCFKVLKAHLLDEFPHF